MGRITVGSWPWEKVHKILSQLIANLKTMAKYLEVFPLIRKRLWNQNYNFSVWLQQSTT
jgi:hypothetical protein